MITFPGVVEKELWLQALSHKINLKSGKIFKIPAEDFILCGSTFFPNFTEYQQFVIHSNNISMDAANINYMYGSNSFEVEKFNNHIEIWGMFIYWGHDRCPYSKRGLEHTYDLCLRISATILEKFWTLSLNELFPNRHFKFIFNEQGMYGSETETLTFFEPHKDIQSFKPKSLNHEGLVKKDVIDNIYGIDTTDIIASSIVTLDHFIHCTFLLDPPLVLFDDMVFIELDATIDYRNINGNKKMAEVYHNKILIDDYFDFNSDIYSNNSKSGVYEIILDIICFFWKKKLSSIFPSRIFTFQINRGDKPYITFFQPIGS